MARFTWESGVDHFIRRSERSEKILREEMASVPSRCRMYIRGHESAVKVARREFNRGNVEKALYALENANEYSGALRECREHWSRKRRS